MQCITKLINFVLDRNAANAQHTTIAFFIEYIFITTFTPYAELLAEDERLMSLSAATAANRAQYRGRQHAAATGAVCLPRCRIANAGSHWGASRYSACPSICCTASGSRARPRRCHCRRHSCFGWYTNDVYRAMRAAFTRGAQDPCYLRPRLPCSHALFTWWTLLDRGRWSCI